MTKRSPIAVMASLPAPPKLETKTTDVARALSELARSYRSAQPAAGQSPWGTLSTNSADSELVIDLTRLRGRSRQVCRDSGYAKRAKQIVVDNVIGAKIGLQGAVRDDAGDLLDDVNEEIECEWEGWKRAEYCHTGGELHFDDLERLNMGETFETGESFVRFHRRSFGGSPIPLGLELVESERVPLNLSPQPATRGNMVRMCVEMDNFHRPIGYWVLPHHPSELRYDGYQNDRVEFVQAADMLHLRIIERWPQARGVPWMHTAMRKLQEMDGYTEAEIIGARAASMILGWMEGNDWDDQLFDQAVANEEIPDDLRKQLQQARQINLKMAPGTILTPPPGFKMQFFSPNRPNAALEAFMRHLLREMAAGIGVSYEALSKDYSQTNYSSSRLSLIDDRERWRIFQGWSMRAFRERLHREWMNAAVLAGRFTTFTKAEYYLDPDRFNAVKYKPRGWEWVDPKNEVGAYIDAIGAGLTSRDRVVSLTGGGDDVDDVDEQREAEIASAEERGLVYSVDPAGMAAAKPGSAPPAGDGAAPSKEAQNMMDDHVAEMHGDGAQRANVRAIR